ncbi:hypothetical protein V8E55_011813 [Tylopilus felleus]
MLVMSCLLYPCPRWIVVTKVGEDEGEGEGEGEGESEGEGEGMCVRTRRGGKGEDRWRGGKSRGVHAGVRRAGEWGKRGRAGGRDGTGTGRTTGTSCEYYSSDGLGVMRKAQSKGDV